MGNWFAGAAGVVLTGWLLQQIGKGGRRWRSLTTANHELEVASRLPEDHPLAKRLREAAESKLERYLREPVPGRGPAIREGAMATVGTCYFVVLLFTLELRWWGYMGLGFMAVLMALTSSTALWSVFKQSSSPAG